MNYLCSSSDLISMLALTRGSAVRRNYPKTANPLSRVSLPRRGSERDFIRSWRFNISSSTWEELASRGENEDWKGITMITRGNATIHDIISEFLG